MTERRVGAYELVLVLVLVTIVVVAIVSSAPWAPVATGFFFGVISYQLAMRLTRIILVR